MPKVIYTNTKSEYLKSIIYKDVLRAAHIRVVTAFFNDSDSILDWVENGKTIDLLVSLRPPTDYYALKEIMTKPQVNIRFLGNKLHSKFYLFNDGTSTFLSIIGSSNFTSAGFEHNYETNALLKEQSYVLEIEREFYFLWNKASELQVNELEEYKSVFDNFKKRKKETDEEHSAFFKKITENRGRVSASSRGKNGRDSYLKFWSVVNEIRDIVNEISETEYPGIPTYLTADHFWHWIVKIWENPRKSNTKLDTETIRDLFIQYCLWDKSNENYTEKMYEKSENIFKVYLSKEHLPNLTLEQFIELYKNLHSGKNQDQRFKRSQKIITRNSIEQIRNSLYYLLYSNDEIELRIYNLCKKNNHYNLTGFGKSAVSELPGWVNPEQFPIRNNKAKNAVKLLGYSLN